MKVIPKETNKPNDHNSPKHQVPLNNPKDQKGNPEDTNDLEMKSYKIAPYSKQNKSHELRSKLSPLDIKKKKIIQQIRTLLNDYPSVHPLAHKVLISANYRVLYDLHLNLLGLDGFAHKNREQKVVADKSKKPNSIAKATTKEVPKDRGIENNSNPNQSDHDDPMMPWDKENLDTQSPQYQYAPYQSYNQNTNIEYISNALERAKRLTQKRRVIELEQVGQNGQERPKKDKPRKSTNPFEDLEIELNIN
jgi:hypothetical protein